MFIMSSGLGNLVDSLSNDKCSLINTLLSEMKIFGEVLQDDNDKTALNKVLDVVKKLALCNKERFLSFFDTIGDMGSFQIMVSAGYSAVYGLDVEIGLNIDIQHIASLITTGRWEANTKSPLASIHFGYAISAGVSGGADADLAFGYHTSRPNGVDGFGFGVNLEGSAGLGAGVVSAPMHV